MVGEYFTYHYEPTNDNITFCRTADGSIFSKVDNSFAHANGYANRADMEAEVRAAGMELPEWLLWHNGLTADFQLN